MKIQEIKRSTLLINKKIAQNNIEFMLKKAQKHRLLLRPHFKTHQSAEVAQWFRSKGVAQITVSSIQMAQYFAQNGWNDITIAFPLNIREIEEISVLAKQINLNVLISSNILLIILQHGCKQLAPTL